MAAFPLSSQNPWWIDASAIDLDNHIVKRDNSLLRWDPRLIYTFDLEIDAVYTLRGPRQVGKSTSVKLLIKKLIENGIHARHIFYWTCDLIQGPNELVQLLDSFITTTREITKDRLYVFLDEISAVRDWQRGIKYLHDTGKLDNVTLLLTGSHSIDLRNAAERLPGRRGESSGIVDKILLPMKFSEYVELRDPELQNLILRLKIYRIANRTRLIESLSIGNIPFEIKEMNNYSDRLSLLFNNYLLTGGIIASINAFLQNGIISNELYQTYLNVTRGDLSGWGKRETYLAAILNRVEQTLTSKTSWRNLIKETDISHTSTATEYIDILESSYILQTIYNLDTNTGKPRREKEKKIYFRDPFIFHSIRAWIKQSDPFETAITYLESTDKPKLVESVICDHLVRLAFNLNPSGMFEPKWSVFYWASKKHEVDFVLKYAGKLLPLEVKYQNIIKKRDYTGLGAFPSPGPESQGILLTKNHLDQHRGTVAIPVHLFLVLI